MTLSNCSTVSMKKPAYSHIGVVKWVPMHAGWVTVELCGRANGPVSYAMISKDVQCTLHWVETAWNRRICFIDLNCFLGSKWVSERASQWSQLSARVKRAARRRWMRGARYRASRQVKGLVLYASILYHFYPKCNGRGKKQERYLNVTWSWRNRQKKYRMKVSRDYCDKNILDKRS